MATSGGGGGGRHTKNKTESPMLISILFHEVIINKCIVIVFIPYTVYNI